MNMLAQWGILLALAVLGSITVGLAKSPANKRKVAVWLLAKADAQETADGVFRARRLELSHKFGGVN